MSGFQKISYWKQEHCTCVRNNTSHLKELSKVGHNMGAIKYLEGKKERD